MHIAKTTAVSLISVLNPTLIMQSSEELSSEFCAGLLDSTAFIFNWVEKHSS